jgi:hypothetical protein
MMDEVELLVPLVRELGGLGVVLVVFFRMVWPDVKEGIVRQRDALDRLVTLCEGMDRRLVILEQRVEIMELTFERDQPMTSETKPLVERALLRDGTS